MDVGAAAPTACSGAGTSVFAVKASDVSPGEGGLVGPACNVDNVLRQDEKLAGLERSNDFNTGTGLLGGKQVTGCVAVEFAGIVDLSSIFVRMAPTPNACGTPCKPDACGTGHIALVFAGDSLAALQHLADVPLDRDDLSDYAVAPPVDGTLRVIVVCRLSFGASRDDVAVDVIRGACR